MAEVTDNPGMTVQTTPPRLSMTQVLLCGAFIVTLSMGIRHGFGLWLQPITAFLWAPLTPWSVYLFSAVMGLLWLSTVPPTNAVIAQIFGVQYMSMLGGFVFLSHQVGSFMGVWLGGRLYDAYGSYQQVWWIAVALGVFAALVNLPVRESAIVRPQVQPA